MSHLLSVVDVGHGNCSVIVSGEKCVVVDAASRMHLLKFLQSNNIDSVDLLILSHSDQDHIGGLLAVLASEIKVGCIVASADSQKYTVLWEDVRALIADRVENGKLILKIGTYAGADEEFLGVSDRLKLEVVSPSVKMAITGSGLPLPKERKSLNSNSVSIAIRVFFDSKPVALLAGDLDYIALSEIIRTKRDISAPYLIFPHHGGLPGSSDSLGFTQNLLELTRPDTVIFSNGRGKHDNPRPEVVAKVREAFPEVYIACTQLSKSCCDNNTIRPAYKPKKYSAGMVDDFFCAGSIDIDLESSQFEYDAKKAHENFTGGLERSLCRGGVIFKS